MGFQPWVPQQDTNTEIRVAMLLSLSLQIALIFLGPMRKRSSFPRVIVWSCYLLTDWVADIALGLILNNMGNIGSGGTSSPIIFAFWTPFLLLHLGGPDTITAYSVEDNELWLRHLIGLLFELFSAAIIFFCSLHSNPMIPATVLIFIVGIIKYSERTYSLYSGSIRSFRANIGIIGPKNPDDNYVTIMRQFNSKKKAGLVVEMAILDGEAAKAREHANRLGELWGLPPSLSLQAYDLFLIFRRLFVDLFLNSEQRRMSRAFFLEHVGMNASAAFEIIELELNFLYDMVYTKAPVAHTRAGWILRSICSGCIISTLVIFFLHDKRGIKRVDVRITYALLLGALALDMAALAMLLFSDHMSVSLRRSRRFNWLVRVAAKLLLLLRRKRCWSESVAQFNLISYAWGRPQTYKGHFFLSVATMLRAKEALEDLIFVQHVPLRRERWEPEHILDRVFLLVRKASERYGDKDDAIAMVFNGRGDVALGRFEKHIKDPKRWGEKKFELIMGRVVKIKDFDESLLLWHIATELCRFRQVYGPPTEKTVTGHHIGVTLSDYMMYLLMKQPEMLSAKSGFWLMRFHDTCAEARRFMDSWIGSPGEARLSLLEAVTSYKPEEGKDYESKSVLFDACILAKELQGLDDELMWMVLSEVWLEILIYAARKCPGSTHVRQLNRGGELITLVWFLMAHLGLGDVYDTTKVAGTMAKLIIHDQ
ncbi:hypothetical protein EJB05_25754, partial [Eragrostis curvula]